MLTNYQEARVKVANTQLNNLKSAAKIKTRTILRLNKKNVEDENAFANNMSTDIKLSKAQTSKIIQSGESFAS